MRIHLAEIPEEGSSWSCTQLTGELTEVLTDLIGPRGAYEAQFVIRPLQGSGQGGTFDLKGRIRTTMPEVCSRCGIDFVWPVNEEFHELLLPSLDQPRNSHFSKANHISDLSDQDLSVVEYEAGVFDVGDYLHEIVALSMPPVPAPARDPEGRCVDCKAAIPDQSFSYDEAMEQRSTHPFTILKELKRN